MLFPPQTFARQRQTCNGKPLRSIDFNTIARENTNYNCLQFIVIKGRAHSQNCSSFCIFSSNDSETTKPGLQIGYPKAADAVRINTRQDYCGSHFSSSVLSDFIFSGQSCCLPSVGHGPNGGTVTYPTQSSCMWITLQTNTAEVFFDSKLYSGESSNILQIRYTISQ